MFELKTALVFKWGLMNEYRLCIKKLKIYCIMKVVSSLKSHKKRDINSKLVRRRGRIYIINKKNPKYKARQK